MEKNKTALQTLIAWGDKMLMDNPPKILSFAEVIDKAQELLPMEREQIIDAYKHGQNNGYMYRDGNSNLITAEQYFTGTYQSTK